MNNHTPHKQSRPVARWLALAGLAFGLAVPFSASAHESDNGAVEVLASAAVAYAVIGTTVGFDDHRHHHRHYDRHDWRYRDGYRGRHDWRYRDGYRGRYGWDDRAHRRQDWHAYKHRKWSHDHKRWKDHDNGRRGHDGHDYRARAYH